LLFNRPGIYIKSLTARFAPARTRPRRVFSWENGYGFQHFRFESAESEPYQFPRVLSDNELERFLELDRIAVNISKKINQAGVKVATPSRGPEDPKAVPNSDIRVAAIKKLSSRASLPAALITFFSSISINHYSQFVRIYEAEIERRKQLRGHT
jgi:hypothetical protein